MRTRGSLRGRGHQRRGGLLLDTEGNDQAVQHLRLELRVRWPGLPDVHLFGPVVVLRAGDLAGRDIFRAAVRNVHFGGSRDRTVLQTRTVHVTGRRAIQLAGELAEEVRNCAAVESRIFLRPVGFHDADAGVLHLDEEALRQPEVPRFRPHHAGRHVDDQPPLAAGALDLHAVQPWQHATDTRRRHLGTIRIVGVSGAPLGKRWHHHGVIER